MAKPASRPKTIGEVARIKSAVADTWFGQLAKRSRALVLLVVAYVAALATAFRWFFGPFKALYDQSPRGFWCVVVGPILFIVAFDVVPRLIQARRAKRRELIALEPVPDESADPYFRLDPYVKATPADFRRQDGLHERVLHWIRETTRPILFLSGVSGSGKSSLLEGYVIPTLCDDGWRVIEVLPSADNLARLEDALAAPRRRGMRLLIVFDQFEEFVILEGQSSFEQCQAFLKRTRAFRNAAPPGVCLLFAFRTDYQSAVEALELEEMSFSSTWIEVGLFRRSAAREFLQGAPERPSQELVGRLLNGADALDDAPGLYRPVTLNMLGLTFQRFDREFTGIPEQQVQGYLEAAISDRAIQNIAPRVIKELITGDATKQAQSVESLSAATGISLLDVKACLNRLSSKGLARHLGDGAGLWTLSHDFVARQFALLLRHLQPSPWPRLVYIASPSLFALALALAILWVHTRDVERHALTELQALNVSITGEGKDKQATFCRTENASESDTSKLPFFCVGGDRDQILSKAAPFLPEAGIYQVDLDQTGITKLDPLSGLTNLSRIDCEENDIHSLVPLQKLNNLTELDASFNYELKSLEGLAQLKRLKTLALAQTQIADLTPLNALIKLESLDISNTVVDSIAPLAELASLRYLFIDGTQVKGLAAANATLQGLRARDVQITGALAQAVK